jgi:hypothetical protein
MAASAGCGAAFAADRPGAPRPVRYGPGRLLCNLANKQVDESSGVACSRRRDGVFWTHNDSGDEPHIFAFDKRGRDLAEYEVRGALNRDWEDIASFRLDGKDWLLIADTGDNDQERPFATLYLVAEPAVEPDKTGVKGKVDVARTIHFTYDDGPQDCESVAVDPTTRTVYLVAKRGKRTVYALGLPRQAGAKRLAARTIARLDIGPAVAMDISPDGLRAIVLTYLLAYEYVRTPGEGWAAAFARGGRRVWVPVRRQGESICYGPGGRTLYLTSEKQPTPLLEVPALPEKPATTTTKPS